MVTIKQNLFFPFIIRGTFLVMAIIFFNNGSPFPIPQLNPVVFHSITILGLIILFTTRLQFDIDSRTQTTHNYVWVLGIKIGQREKYNQIEKIFINKIDTSSNLQYPYLSAIAMQSRGTLFKSFIKIDDHKQFLTSDWKKERLLKRLNALNAVLQTSIYDNTDGQAILVK